jgi:hypothetical protein
MLQISTQATSDKADMMSRVRCSMSKEARGVRTLSVAVTGKVLDEADL